MLQKPTGQRAQEEENERTDRYFRCLAEVDKDHTASRKVDSNISPLDVEMDQLHKRKKGVRQQAKHQEKGDQPCAHACEPGRSERPSEPSARHQTDVFKVRNKFEKLQMKKHKREMERESKNRCRIRARARAN